MHNKQNIESDEYIKVSELNVNKNVGDDYYENELNKI